MKINSVDSVSGNGRTSVENDPASSAGECAGGCTGAIPATSIAVSPSARAFDVAGLDCAEEVRILERAVGPVVGGKERLAFDVLNGRMRVLETADDVSDASIAAAIETTGMRATRVGEAGDGDARTGPSRAPMTALSGAAVVLGARRATARSRSCRPRT